MHCNFFFLSTAGAAVRTVVLSGTQAADAPAGVNYNSFGAHFLTAVSQYTFRGPVINDAGQAAFRADVVGPGVDSTNDQGIWSEGSGNLSLVARTGSAAHGVPAGVNFSRNPALELFEPVLNNAGQTAFFGGLTDGTVGMWSEGSGSLALVARDGTPAPGTPAGVSFSFGGLRGFYPDLPKLNDAGQIGFWANVTGPGIHNMNDWGVWSDASGSLSLVARSGSPAPGTSAGVNFDGLIFQSGFNAAGQSAFSAFVTGPGVDPSNDFGIWSEGSGSLALVARNGSPAPGVPSGVTFRDFVYPVAFNDAGKTAFVGFVTGTGVDQSNELGIWSEGSGSLELVARQGSAAPGTPSGVNFGGFDAWTVLNDQGQMAFWATLAGSSITATNYQGIWVEESGSLELVARMGSPAAGTPAGVNFSDLQRPTLNTAGQVAFIANLAGGGVGTSNNLGIWATDQTGMLQLIARTGGQLEVAPGVFRTISDLGMASDSGNSDGRASAFNNLGELVFWARFTNGSQGVFVSNAVAHLPGDFNNDGTVDTADYLVWRNNDASQIEYDLWRDNFGRTLFTGSAEALSLAERPSAIVPEPTCIALAAAALGACMLRTRRRLSRGCHDRLAKQSRRLSKALAVAIGIAIPHVAALTAQGTTIAFDASAKSPAVIPFDPDAVFEARNGYVSGRIPTNVRGPVQGGTNISTMLGADTFYDQGFTGTNAVIANIEAGHIWNGHETLAHALKIPTHPFALDEFDRHATWVATMLAGRRGGANPGAYQEGLAPDAQLYSGAIATQHNGNRPSASFSVNNSSTFDQYRRAFSTGVNAAGRRADVINSSWGSTGNTNGSDTHSTGFDAFANTDPRTLFVVAAGNTGPGPDQVWSPAAAYNNLSVAALGPNPPYDRPASFSSGGPNDYADPINGTANNSRQVVDIAAPGENLAAAYYGGETGSNGTTNNPSVSGPGPTGLPSGSLGGPDYYSRGALAGTSFAAPTVAGGAALLYDAAYSVFANNADARDARVMKAVLMNSADKTVGWNNGQIAHPNGYGGVRTTQGLDNRVGTGRMNLDAAYDQFLSGTTDVADTASGNLGLVDSLGWDFGQVTSGVTNDYFFDTPLLGGSTFTATLTWFRDRRINVNNAIFDDSYDDLNLELWSVAGGIPNTLISESSSLFNSSEHFSFLLPFTGDYALRVRWFREVFDVVGDANQEVYGLAWSAVAIPEPASSILLMVAVAMFGAFSRDRRSHQLNCARTRTESSGILETDS